VFIVFEYPGDDYESPAKPIGVFPWLEDAQRHARWILGPGVDIPEGMIAEVDWFADLPGTGAFQAEVHVGNEKLGPHRAFWNPHANGSAQGRATVSKTIGYGNTEEEAVWQCARLIGQREAGLILPQED